jgi:hypothetical protein
MVGIISFVGQHAADIDAVDKVLSKRSVIALAGTYDQADRDAERFGGGLDFGAQAAMRPTQALGIRPSLNLCAPAACW